MGSLFCCCECGFCGSCGDGLDGGGLSLLEEFRDGMLDFDRFMCEWTLEDDPFVLYYVCKGAM